MMIDIISVILFSALGFVAGWFLKPAKKINVQVIQLEDDPLIKDLKKFNKDLKAEMESFFKKDMDEK